MHQVYKILFCHETLRVSGICAHHQELSAVHVAIGRFHAGYVAAEFQPDSPRRRPHNLHETYQLPRVQLITHDGHRCPKHLEFRDKIQFCILDASCWLFIRRSVSLFRITYTCKDFGHILGFYAMAHKFILMFLRNIKPPSSGCLKRIPVDQL